MFSFCFEYLDVAHANELNWFHYRAYIIVNNSGKGLRSKSNCEQFGERIGKRCTFAP